MANIFKTLELKFHFNRWRKTESTDSDFSILIKLILLSEFKPVSCTIFTANSNVRNKMV